MLGGTSKLVYDVLQFDARLFHPSFPFSPSLPIAIQSNLIECVCVQFGSRIPVRSGQHDRLRLIGGGEEDRIQLGQAPQGRLCPFRAHANLIQSNPIQCGTHTRYHEQVVTITGALIHKNGQMTGGVSGVDARAASAAAAAGEEGEMGAVSRWDEADVQKLQSARADTIKVNTTQHFLPSGSFFNYA